jgi:hypothetical protein
MLSKVMPIDLNYEIYEDKQDGEAVLVKAGTYQPQA